jgi:hypothetical protein
MSAKWKNLKIAKKLFPISKGEFRYAGFPWRVKIYDWERCEELIYFHNLVSDCYISLASYDPNPKLEFVFFDLDGKGSFEDTKQLSAYFEKENYLPYYIINSGNGFHVILKIKKESISKKQLEIFYDKILSEVELKSFDNHVKGDISRMIRIPGTINLKGGNICHFLENNKYSVDELGKISLIEIVKNLELNEEMYNISDENENNKLCFYSELHDFPCLENQLKEKEPSHISRMLYVSLLIQQGYTEKEIFHKLESYHWIDWDPKITLYQIRHIRSNNYAPPTCKSLKKRGICDKSCEKYYYLRKEEKNNINNTNNINI